MGMEETFYTRLDFNKVTAEDDNRRLFYIEHCVLCFLGDSEFSTRILTKFDGSLRKNLIIYH